MAAFAACFEDRRQPGLISHTVPEPVSQRVYALALGYEDLSDHDQLREDPLLAIASHAVTPPPFHGREHANQTCPNPLPDGDRTR